jgi:hypothetical protein
VLLAHTTCTLLSVLSLPTHLQLLRKRLLLHKGLDAARLWCLQDDAQHGRDWSTHATPHCADLLWQQPVRKRQ